MSTREAWQELYGVEGADVRTDVRTWVRQQVEMEMADRGLLQ